MKAASRNELDGDAWKLYDYITRHFIATVSPDCRYISTTATFNINDEIFTTTGKTVVDPGFTTIMTWQVVTYEPNFWMILVFIRISLIYTFITFYCICWAQ